MMAMASIWAFLPGLFAGPWKLAIVAAAVVMLYGRTIRPYMARFLAVREAHPSQVATPQPRPILQGRLYFLLVVMAATAVATWIILRMTVSVAAHAHP